MYSIRGLFGKKLSIVPVMAKKLVKMRQWKHARNLGESHTRRVGIGREMIHAVCCV